MIHQFIEVKRRDGRKIYKSFTGIVTKCEVWERETINGEVVKVPMCAVQDIDGQGVTWHCKDEIEEVVS